jgi:hypothetical protein
MKLHFTKKSPADFHLLRLRNKIKIYMDFKASILFFLFPYLVQSIYL